MDLDKVFVRMGHAPNRKAAKVLIEKLREREGGEEDFNAMLKKQYGIFALKPRKPQKRTPKQQRKRNRQFFQFATSIILVSIVLWSASQQYIGLIFVCAALWLICHLGAYKVEDNINRAESQQ